MTDAQKENAIQTYFAMWITRDFTGLEALFAPDIYYSECYGPEYSGLTEIHQWIDAMLQKQQVLEWTIKSFLHDAERVAVEWQFRHRMDGNEQGFDGVSLIAFAGDGKMTSIQEFGSKMEHETPYRQVQK